MHYHFILTIITAVFAGVGASAVLKHQPMTANKLVQDIGEIRDDIHNCTTQGAGWSNWNGLVCFELLFQKIKVSMSCHVVLFEIVKKTLGK